MVIEYDKKYDEDIKDLLVEIQEHICDIDVLGYNILTKDYRELCFKDNFKELKKCNGKILLYKDRDKDKVIGLVIGLINNDFNKTYDFEVPRRGRITELVVSKNARSRGIGTILLNEMEEYLKSIGCKDILLGVFAYNDKAIKFYEKNGYHMRMIDMTKSNV